MSKSSKRQFLVKVSGIDGYFATKTGGEISADTTKVYDGGSLQPDVLAGPPGSSNVVVSRPYDPDRDAPIVNALIGQVGRFAATVSVQPATRDLVATGAPRVYPNALLAAVRDSDADAASGDAAMFELEFVIGAFK